MNALRKQKKTKMKMNIDQLREHFLLGYEDLPDELVLELNISTEEIVERFEDKIVQFWEENHNTGDEGDEDEE